MGAAAEDTSRSTDPTEAKLAKRKALIDAGYEAYPHDYKRTHMAAELQESYKDLADGTETEDQVAVAGRIMAMRNNGMFIDLMDTSGRIQVFCHKDSMNETELEKLKFFDIGDVINALGTIRRTPRGELSVRCTEVSMLCKSTLPLPEKHHGLCDIEQRYRQRYVDLIMNEESKVTLLARSKIIKFIRDYLNNTGALEVENPMLQPIMGGATAKPFITHHNTLGSDFYLKVAAELYLKRLLVGGLAEHVYEIGRYFRNEGISPKHNPEFTMGEGNKLYANYEDMMDLIEDLVSKTVEHLHGTHEIVYGDHVINFARPWKRISMIDSVKNVTKIDFMAIESAEEAQKAAKEYGLSVDPKWNWGQVVEEMFAEYVEPTLIQPTHITDFPFEISPLAKTHRTNPRLVERFETFINGWEIANAFTELNDPDVQHERFMDQVAQREDGNDEAQMLDEDYVTALRYGLPPNAGWGLGIDRLTMILTNSHNIRDVICFPTLKPKA